MTADGFEKKNNKLSHLEQPEILNIPAHWLNSSCHFILQCSYLVIDEIMILNYMCNVIWMMDDWDYFLIQLIHFWCSWLNSKNKCWEAVTESFPRWGHWSKLFFSFCFNEFKTTFVRKNQEMFFSKPRLGKITQRIKIHFYSAHAS